MMIKNPQPKSSFLSTEKDLNLITSAMLKNERLKRLLHYTTRDALDRNNLTEDETLSLFGKNIKLVPKLTVDGSVLNYIIISFEISLQVEILNLEIISLSQILFVILINGNYKILR